MLIISSLGLVLLLTAVQDAAFEEVPPQTVVNLRLDGIDAEDFEMLKRLEKSQNINLLTRNYLHSAQAIVLAEADAVPVLKKKLPKVKISDITAESERYLRSVNELNEQAKYASYSNYFVEEITTHFPDMNEIESWQRGLVSKYAGRVSVSEFGRTYENRPMTVMKVNIGKNLPIVIIESAIHSREWLAPVACMRMANKVIKRTDPQFDKFEFHFIIVANPDGYVYTHQYKNTMSARFWRKNRRPNPQNSRCVGADLNRNWDIDFGRVGVSWDCNTEVYPGPSAFSEPESRALANYARSVASKTRLYLSVHTFGQMIITPYVYKMQKPSDNAYQYNKATQAGNAMFRYSGERYRIGNGIELGLGAVSGSTIDYMKDKLGIKNAFAFELRPNNQYVQGLAGFAPSPSQIVPGSEEFVQGVRAMLSDLA